MKNNSQDFSSKNKSPFSSKSKSKKNPQFYLNLQNKDEQMVLKSIPQNPSNSKISSRDNKSQTNESQELKKDSLNDMYSYIQKIWYDIGITENYQLQFHNTISNLNDEEQISNILINEKNNLNRFRDVLTKVSKEMKSRDNNIHSLQKNMVVLSAMKNDFETDKKEKFERNREKIILEIIGLIKSLRINSINVVQYFSQVRELATYLRLKGKIDVKLINSDYKYNDNYLKKMRRDMEFLKDDKYMKRYFDMNNGEIDAFLTNFEPKPSNNLNYIKFNSNKAKIPVSEDLKKAIIKCRYILLQEEIFDKMQNEEIGADNDINNFDYKNNNKITFKPKLVIIKEKEDNQSEYPNIFDANSNIKNKMFNKRNFNSSGKIPNSSKDVDFQERKTLDSLRINMGKEYNNLFLNNKNINFNLKSQNKNNIQYNISENNFRKPLKVGSNKIKIFREERKKERIQLELNNNLYKQDPLKIENQELTRQLNDVCETNEILEEDIKNFKEKIKDMVKVNTEKEKQAQKREKDHQILQKKMSDNINELNLENKNLDIKLKANQNLMEKNNKENSEKIQNLNTIMQNMKNEYENNINDLNLQKEGLINEKNELINLKEQLLKEKEELTQKNQNLEDNLLQLNYQISEYKLEIENYKNTISENKQKIEELEKKLNELNNEFTKLQNEKNQLEINSSNKIKELSEKISEMEKNIQINQETITNLENEKKKLIHDKQELFNSDNNAKIQINNLNEQINNLNNQINEKNELINNLELKSKDFDKIKQENDKMKIESNQQKNELEQLKELLKKYIPKYNCDFYRGNLFNFINIISNKLSLDKIPDFIKESFNLEQINIYEESTYLQGVYPKIIISTKENSDEISGFCSVYYENYGYVGDPLILRIGALCVSEQNWEIQIKNIINFIKSNIFFDEIKYVIKYIKNPETGKFKLDEKIKSFFKNDLKSSWKNVINSNGSRTQEIGFVKEGDYFNKDINITNNNQVFGLKSLSVVSLYDKKEEFNNSEEDPEIELKNKYSNIYFNKYINHYPIFLLLANNPQYKLLFEKEEDKNIYEIPASKEGEEYLNPKNQIKEITTMNFNLSNLTKLEENIATFNTSNLLCKEIFDKLQSNINLFSINYLTMEINLSTHTNFCLNYENYIYNRISSKKIEVLRDPESRNYFYLIPTNNENIFIFISQIGEKLKEHLFDKNKNLYKALAELHPKLTNQLVQFSSLNLTQYDQQNIEKVIYIPSFKIDSHLFSFSVKDIKEKGKLVEIDTKKEEKLGSIDECFKLSFEGDENIKDCFSIIPVEDKKLNMIIRESFLFGIFNIGIIENSPLQLYYVTKDHWIKP